MAVSISISITQNSQNVANNTSNVTVKVTAKWTNGSHNALVNASGTPQAHGSLKIDGTSYDFTSTFNTGKTTSGSQTIFTKTVNVSHNSDGSKTLACSASYVTGVSSGTVSASASKALTTIPRKSTLTVANGTLGTAQTLTITEQASTFKHKLEYDCGSASGWILGSDTSFSTSNSVSWTPPLSLAQQNTSGASVSVTFTLTTFTDGGTLVGRNLYTKTFSIPSSVKPSVTVSVSDPMGYKDTYGAYVQGLSKLKILSYGIGIYGSTIKSYKVEADGKTYTAASVETGAIAGTGTLTIKVTVTDSRGRTATASTTVSVLAYEPPKISALKVYRCDANGNASSSGAYLAVKFSATITSLNSKNTAAYTLQYKKSSATSYTTKTLPDFAGKYSVSNGVYVFSADTASSYDIILTAKDAFKSIPKNASGSSVKKVWSLLKSGGEIVGMAIGKVAELANVFDVAFVTRIRENLNVGNKTGHLDGNTGVFICKDGYIQVQRDSSQGYHPYIGFFLDNATEADGLVRLNSSTKFMEFLESAGYKFGSDIHLENNEAIMGYDTSGKAVNAFQPLNNSNNTVIGYGNYDRGSGNTNIYGHDLNFGVSNIPSPGAYRPYRRRGDTFNVVLRTAGYVTNGGKDVSFWLPCSEPIIGSPTVTAASNGGFVLRQGEKYTHGSAADTYVHPASYEATATMYSGIYIKAVFSNDTNVINNDAIGIYWSGTITFS